MLINSSAGGGRLSIALDLFKESFVGFRYRGNACCNGQSKNTIESGICSSHRAECMSKGSTHFWKPCIRAVENSRNAFLCETPFLSFLSMDQCIAQCTYLKLVGVLFQGHTSCKVLDQYV